MLRRLKSEIHKLLYLLRKRFAGWLRSTTKRSHFEGAMRDIRCLPLYQSKASYTRTLLELERRANENELFSYFDCTETGCKDTQCTLGLCDGEIRESMDGVYQNEGDVCPNDKRYFDREGNLIARPASTMGCFYHCWIFQERNPSKTEAQNRIRRVVKKAIIK
jgi:hypothetical protein